MTTGKLQRPDLLFEPGDVAVREMPRLSQRSVMALTAMRQIEMGLAGDADLVSVCRLVTSGLATITLADLAVVSGVGGPAGATQVIAVTATMERPINPQGLDIALADEQVRQMQPGRALQIDLQTSSHGLSSEQIESLKELAIVRVIVFPLIRHGRYLGRIDLWFRRLVGRGPVENDLCQQLVGHAASALALARSTALTNENELQSLLSRVNEVLHQAQPGGPDELLQAFVGAVPSLLGCDRCYAFVWQQEQQQFRPIAVGGMDEAGIGILKRHSMSPREVPLFEQVLYATSPVIVGSVRHSTMLPLALVEALNIESLVAVPMRDQRRELLAVVVLDHCTPGAAFSAVQASRISSIIEQVSGTIENAIRFEGLRGRLDRMAMLNEMGVALALESDLPRLLSTLQSKLANIIDATALCCGLVDANGRNLTIYHLVNGQLKLDHGIDPGASALLQQVFQSGEPIIVNAGADALLEGVGSRNHIAPNAASIISVPLAISPQSAIGMLAVYSSYEHAYGEDDFELLKTAGSQIAVLAEQTRQLNALRSTAELRGQLLDRLISEREIERKNIVDDIHDEILQALVSSMYKIDLVLRSDQPSQQRWIDELRGVRANMATTVDQLRELIFRIRPSTLDYLGLLPTLDEYLVGLERDAGIHGSVRSRLGSRLDRGMETLVYRLLQELLSNVRRHSRAKTVNVSLTRIENSIEIVVEDDGIGFVPQAITDLDQSHRGIGLATVGQQVAVANGMFEIQSQPGAGTKVMIILPITAGRHITGPLDQGRVPRDGSGPFSEPRAGLIRRR